MTISSGLLLKLCRGWSRGRCLVAERRSGFRQPPRARRLTWPKDRN